MSNAIFQAVELARMGFHRIGPMYFDSKVIVLGFICVGWMCIYIITMYICLILHLFTNLKRWWLPCQVNCPEFLLKIFYAGGLWDWARKNTLLGTLKTFALFSGDYFQTWCSSPRWDTILLCIYLDTCTLGQCWDIHIQNITKYVYMHRIHMLNYVWFC